VAGVGGSTGVDGGVESVFVGVVGTTGSLAYSCVVSLLGESFLVGDCERSSAAKHTLNFNTT
jgi:hypothetical protein